MRVEVVRGNQGHIEHIVNNLRDDVERKYYCNDGREILIRNFQTAIMTFTGLVDEVPVVLLGVTAMSPLSQEGYLWLLASKEISSYPIAFLRHGKRCIDRLMAEQFTCLYGGADWSFEGAHKLFKWLEFSQYGATPAAVMYVRHRWTQ